MSSTCSLLLATLSFLVICLPLKVSEFLLFNTRAMLQQQHLCLCFHFFHIWLSPTWLGDEERERKRKKRVKTKNECHVTIIFTKAKSQNMFRTADTRDDMIRKSCSLLFYLRHAGWHAYGCLLACCADVVVHTLNNPIHPLFMNVYFYSISKFKFCSVFLVAAIFLHNRFKRFLLRPSYRYCGKQWAWHKLRPDLILPKTVYIMRNRNPNRVSHPQSKPCHC